MAEPTPNPEEGRGGEGEWVRMTEGAGIIYSLIVGILRDRHTARLIQQRGGGGAERDADLCK